MTFFRCVMPDVALDCSYPPTHIRDRLFHVTWFGNEGASSWEIDGSRVSRFATKPDLARELWMVSFCSLIVAAVASLGATASGIALSSGLVAVAAC